MQHPYPHSDLSGALGEALLLVEREGLWCHGYGEGERQAVRVLVTGEKELDVPLNGDDNDGITKP